MDNVLILKGRIELVDLLTIQAAAAYVSSLNYQIKGKVQRSRQEHEKSRELSHQAREWNEKTLAPLHSFFI